MKGDSVYQASPVSVVPDKTVVKGISLGAFAMGTTPSAVDIKNGKMVRIRPLHYDWKYTHEELNPWKLSVRGREFKPILKSLQTPFALAYKKRTYSPNRIKYPLKRVDWDPEGERHPENRGKSKYKRISWDEATNIIVSEIKRIQQKYGPYAILAQGEGHGEGKTLHGPHGCQMLLLEKIGGYTLGVRNPDSWEGWYWGAMHVWGTMVVGLMDPLDNCFKDISENAQMLLFWGCDPETTPWGMGEQTPSRICYWWKELGIPQVYICPELNYGAAVHADKWIPVLPNTDTALQLAIIYTWIMEGTYDKEYVETHAVGMDKVADYVLGKEDGTPKTPEWASKKCGVPEWTIKALAREFGSKTTTIAHLYGGGYIRGPYSHEPARLEVILLGMQGLGKPGVHSYNKFGGLPRNAAGVQPQTLRREWTGRLWQYNTPQILPKTLLQDAILNPPVTSWGSTQFPAPVEDQFKKYVYPIPKEEGGTEIHMMWSDTPCRTTCWNDGASSIEAFRSPKLECIVVQHPWMENDTVFGDIILPVNTKLEEEDFTLAQINALQFKTIQYEEQCVKPVGESLSDWEAVGEVAKKMGKYKEYVEGKTASEQMESLYNFTGIQKFISWDELKKKKYFVIPTAPDWEKDPPGLRKFYENPEKYPLKTPSGKLEFYSERLAKAFPGDTERQPIPKWIEKSITHDERLSSERAKIFPLLMMTNHPKWRMHAQCDDISWTREIQTHKVKGLDGYLYEPLWLNPQEAEKRGIKNGDIIKVFNERGTVLAGAYVTERLNPEVAYMDHGATCDWIIPGKLDRGGAVNIISPHNITSKNCAGMATSGFLVEVSKVSMTEMEQWRTLYPEAFDREYDPGSGLQFNAWVEGEYSENV
jgi:molybdopterin guanine dinucleotide-containing S/N-oxide reductase-like protein